MKLNRRNLLKTSAGLGAFSFLPVPVMSGQENEEPHFLLICLFEGGWDPSYLFDARLLAMKEAGHIQNYLDQEPTVWEDNQGRKCLATSLVEPLKPYFDRFSILNGVHMASTFDGHEQNKAYLMAGNPFGGPFLLPTINGIQGKPLDYIQTDNIFGVDLNNAGGGIQLDPGTASDMVRAVTGNNTGDPVMAAANRFNQQRTDVISTGHGQFSEGVRFSKSGRTNAGTLAEKIKLVEIDQGHQSPRMQMIHQFYKNGLTGGVMMPVDVPFNLDCHDIATAKEQPTGYVDLVNEMVEIFKFLAETPLNDSDGPSLLDCTTVVMTSEFGRTMKQFGRDVNETGTDHNPLCNTVLVGGKGVIGGQIIGQSDFQTPDEVLSPAHLQLNQIKNKLMGKVFNHDSGDTAIYDPASITEFKQDDYLTFASIGNKLQEVFGVTDIEKRWKNTRNGDPAPAIKGLFRDS